MWLAWWNAGIDDVDTLVPMLGFVSDSDTNLRKVGALGSGTLFFSGWGGGVTSIEGLLSLYDFGTL